jgi:hypothetical protein
MYDYSRVFLLEDHPYRRVAFNFNGKTNRTQIPKIIKMIDWIWEYGTEKEKEIEELFDSNGEPMFDYLEFFDTYAEKMPIGMKMKYVFYEIPYWEHLKIFHLLDPMHIIKNVSSSLWRLIQLNKSDTLDVRRNLVSLNIKKRHWQRKESR